MFDKKGTTQPITPPANWSPALAFVEASIAAHQEYEALIADIQLRYAADLQTAAEKERQLRWSLEDLKVKIVRAGEVGNFEEGRTLKATAQDTTVALARASVLHAELEVNYYAERSHEAQATLRVCDQNAQAAATATERLRTVSGTHQHQLLNFARDMADLNRSAGDLLTLARGRHNVAKNTFAQNYSQYLEVQNDDNLVKANV